MMEEIFLHLSILADFASDDALQFTPRLKGHVLSCGNIRVARETVFENGHF